MRRITNTIIYLLIGFYAVGQVGMYAEPANLKAELEIVSNGNNTGVLIPRFALGDTTGIATPIQGLLFYATDFDAFYYYTGVRWVKIGGASSILKDSDGDTKIVVDDGADNDEVLMTAHGVDVVNVSKDGLQQLVGDLQSSGTITVNNEYTLPLVDGNNKEIVLTDGAGNVSWHDPLNLPGLVAGLQTIPLVTGREMERLNDRIWLTSIIPWSNITIEHISCYVNVVDLAPVTTIEIGIYDDVTLLGSGTVTISTTGFQFATVTLASAIDLQAGKMYRIGVVDRERSNTTFLENPNYQSTLNWRILLPSVPQSLPATITTYNQNQKPIWLCLY